jgi:hypothetical protein
MKEEISEEKTSRENPLSIQQRGALKLQDTAHYLSLSEISVRRLVERGLLKPNRATRHLLFSLAELNRFLGE